MKPFHFFWLRFWRPRSVTLRLTVAQCLIALVHGSVLAESAKNKPGVAKLGDEMAQCCANGLGNFGGAARFRTCFSAFTLLFVVTGAPPAGWIGNLEIPRGFEEWGALPPGLSANLPVLQSFLEHFAAAMVRDAVLDGYPRITSDVVEGMQELLPLVKAATWKRFAMRHNYDSHVLPSHPHALRNLVLCPVFRCDRESPLLVASLWAEVSKLTFGHVHNLRLASWILFARRAFHNFPVAWEFLQPWLLERVSAAHFSPKSSCFCDGMRALSQKKFLFGKGSHWFCPDLREETDGPVHWIDDTISLLQKFWDALPFVLDCCQTGGDIHMRSWALESLLKGVRGISSYGIKFVQGDLLELFKVTGGPHALSLRVCAAVGPALVKAVLRGSLFTAHGEPLGEARVRTLGCTLVRFLYHALMTRAAGVGVDAVGSIVSSLLLRRHEMFGDSRSSVFDLQDVQCKVCTWVMALGYGQWFTSWRGIGVIVCPVLGAVLTKARATKRRRKQLQAAALSFTPAKSAYTGAADMTIDHLQSLLPVCDYRGKAGVRATDIARVFGKPFPMQDVYMVVRSLTNEEKGHFFVNSGQVGTLVLDPFGAALLMLHMPKNAELKKVKNYCAQVLAREHAAPKRKRACPKSIAALILEVGRSASPQVVFTEHSMA